MTISKTTKMIKSNAGATTAISFGNATCLASKLDRVPLFDNIGTEASAKSKTKRRNSDFATILLMV